MNKQFKSMLIGLTCGFIGVTCGVQAADENTYDKSSMMIVAQDSFNKVKKMTKAEMKLRLHKKEANASKEDGPKYALMREILDQEYKGLETKDLKLANLMIGETMPTDYETEDGSFAIKSHKQQGDFINYKAEEGAFSLNSDSKTVAYVHVDGEKFKTARDVKVGDQRGSITLEYGAPNALWQSQDTKKLVYWYKVPQANGEDGYLAFTVADLKIKAIDTFAKMPVNNGTLPNLTLRDYRPNELQMSDFNLLGHNIADKYIPFKGVKREWDKQGEMNYQNFAASKDGIIVYDEDNNISSVILTLGNSVTRRGVGVGSNVALVLKTYGIPNQIVENFAFQGEKGQVAYEYINPLVNGEYLIFVVNGKDDFVDAIILSNRSAEQMSMYEGKDKTNQLIYGKIASVRKSN